MNAILSIAIRQIILCATVITFGSACSARASSIQANPSITKGQLIERLACLDDPSQSYALYLPSNYTSERKWPILYAFDPGARGKVPVERFQDAAEKHGWIVVGSNNSRNGPWELVVKAWNAMSKDTHQRFSIDDERVYATGFSGGARVAVNIASLCNCLAGVIATGAGFPGGVDPAPSMHFVFFGAVGVDDFNFAELRALADPLAKAGITHRIQTFAGGHGWPPVSVAILAIEWMELQAMRTGKLPREASFLDAMWQKAFKEAKTLEDSKQYDDAYQLYLDLAQSFKGLRDVREIEQKAAQLRDSRELKTAIREEQEEITRQRALERELRALIARRESISLEDARVEGDSASPTPPANRVSRSEEGVDDSNRLEMLLGDLQKRSRASEDSSARRVARRTLEGLFVGFFEKGLGLLLMEKRYGDAVAYLKLAAEIDPDRPGTLFYLAWGYAGRGDKKKSLQALNSAIEKGFSDLPAITDNKAFDLIRNDPRYQKIVSGLKKGK